ncbi:hypothetical protein M9Y10_017389 [Tritrichomonas musculus]|uniref:Initiator binding domain-containing protein n=1 Tax=Tritrichomonas musculus TaxID=1915356 RepID=A0ABR2HUI2_9EUKA
MEDEIRINLDLIEASSSFQIVSEEMQNCRYKAAKTVEIQPENSMSDYRNLAVFINELKEFKYDPKNGVKIQFNPDNAQYFFFKFIKQSNPEHFILLNIKKTITVRVSKPYIDSWNPEQCKMQWIKKSLSFELSSSSQALLKNSPLLYYPQSDFSTTHLCSTIRNLIFQQLTFV